MAGSIASRVMIEPGAPAAIVDGLSERNSPASRRAFLNILNLMIFAGCLGSSSDGFGGGGGDGNGVVRDVELREVAAGDVEDERELSAGRRDSSIALWRATEIMLESQLLLPRLLRTAEHGEGMLLRAKGFLALRLTLEAANPSLLLRACRSRLLPLLARATGTLAPRVAPRAGSPVPSVAPRLSSQQEYLYGCCTRLEDWLCAFPEGAARRLATELRRRGSGDDDVMSKNNAVGERWGGSGDSRRQIAQLRQSEGGNGSLEAATSAFPAVVHLINSPLLRGRAVTSAFVRDVATCLALSCPVDVKNRSNGGESRDSGEQGVGGMVRACESGDVVPNDTDFSSGIDGGDREGNEIALAALLPTVETLAQQAEGALLPHWEAVSGELLPVLCRLLKSRSGDTRALAVAVLRVLLPPLLRSSVPLPHQPQILGTFAPAEGTTAPPPAERMSEASTRVRASVTAHLLPLAVVLLRDQTPIPQYVIRLLVDVAREWNGLGSALTSVEGAIPALIDRLPPTPGSAPLLTPLPCPPGETYDAASAFTPSMPTTQQRGVHAPRRTGTMEPVDATTLDPALAALVTHFVERDDGGGGGEGGDGTGSGGNEKLLIQLLRLELPGRVAAAVAGAVATGVPEAAEAFLGLAVALLDSVSRCGMEGPKRPAARTPDWWEGAHVNDGGISSVGLGGVRRLSMLLQPLLLAVPSALEGMQLFCVRGRAGLANEREQHLMAGIGGQAGLFLDVGLRSGVSDSATAFITLCYQVG